MVPNQHMDLSILNAAFILQFLGILISVNSTTTDSIFCQNALKFVTLLSPLPDARAYTALSMHKSSI